jgi:hypothetical protein
MHEFIKKLNQSVNGLLRKYLDQKQHVSFRKKLNQSANELLRKYLDQKQHVSFRRPLSDFNEHETHKLAELRSMYQPQLVEIKFLKAAYFSDHSHFHRHQDIPEKYFIKGPKSYFFLSHRWEDSPRQADPAGRQFRRFKTYLDKLPPDIRDTSGFWYDFSCIPQADASGHRTEQEEREFANALKVLHILATLSHTVILFTEGHLDRSWCCAEWIFASSISPLLVDEEQIFPFANAVKFRHLAMLILFLSHDSNFRTKLLTGEDRFAISFINSLLKHTMESTEATWGDDKLFLNLVLHRHFWYHVRALGLRNQLAMAFLLLCQYDDKFVESLFRQFLFLTADPELNWTRHALIEIDTMLLENPDPFKDVHFHNNRIKVVSHSGALQK